jgi:hypothetical protein
MSACHVYSRVSLCTPVIIICNVQGYFYSWQKADTPTYDHPPAVAIAGPGVVAASIATVAVVAVAAVPAATTSN